MTAGWSRESPSGNVAQHERHTRCYQSEEKGPQQHRVVFKQMVERSCEQHCRHTDAHNEGCQKTEVVALPSDQGAFFEQIAQGAQA